MPAAIYRGEHHAVRMYGETFEKDAPVTVTDDQAAYLGEINDFEIVTGAEEIAKVRAEHGAKYPSVDPAITMTGLFIDPNKRKDPAMPEAIVSPDGAHVPTAVRRARGEDVPDGEAPQPEPMTQDELNQADPVGEELRTA